MTTSIKSRTTARSNDALIGSVHWCESLSVSLETGGHRLCGLAIFPRIDEAWSAWIRAHNERAQAAKSLLILYGNAASPPIANRSDDQLDRR